MFPGRIRRLSRCPKGLLKLSTSSFSCDSATKMDYLSKKTKDFLSRSSNTSAGLESQSVRTFHDGRHALLNAPTHQLSGSSWLVVTKPANSVTTPTPTGVWLPSGRTESPRSQITIDNRLLWTSGGQSENYLLWNQPIARRARCSSSLVEHRTQNISSDQNLFQKSKSFD